MVQTRVGGRVLVKTAFPLGQRRGHVFTSGRHAQGRPELVLLNQPLEAKNSAVTMLEYMASLDFKEGGMVVEGVVVFVATAVPRDKARELLSTTLRALGRRTRLLQLRRAVDKDRFKTAEEEAYIESLSRDMLTRPCSGCGATCGCGDEKYLSSQLGGESVYTGLIATSDGLYKEHDDGSRHKVDATEFNLDESIYDTPIAVVPDDLHPAPATRGSAEMQAAMGTLEATLSAMEANVSGAKRTMLPTEVRTGDLVFRVDARCKDPDCRNCHQMLEVAAVHHGNRGVIVVDDNVPAPFRISLDTIAVSIQGPHWGDGDAMEEEDEGE